MLKLLVVTQSTDILDTYKALTASHMVSSASTYAEAVDMVQNQSFHLAFLDTVFTPISCFDLVYSLQTLDPTLPLIARLGWLTPHDMRIGKRLPRGFIKAYLKFPLTEADLKRMIKKHARRTTEEWR